VAALVGAVCVSLRPPARAARRRRRMSRAERFHGLQLRSVLDAPGSLEPDPAWQQLLAHPMLVSNAAVPVRVAFPSTAEAEVCWCETLHTLAKAFACQTAPLFYQTMGWSTPEEIFSALGERVLMIVDVDHNDSDDRLAIIILAFLLASANLHKRQLQSDAADACCTLVLDSRTYDSSGLCASSSSSAM
jgi:hypothetical protein